MSPNHYAFIGMLFGLSTSIFAASPDHLVMSNCLANKVRDHVQIIAHTNQYSLVSTNLSDELLVTLHNNRVTCGKFINLDYAYQGKSLTPTAAHKLLSELTNHNPAQSNQAYALNHPEQVKNLYQLLDRNRIWQSMQHLTSYNDRSAKSKTGVEAAQWFKQQFDNLATDHQRKDAESYIVKTGSKYPQPSVVTVIGKDKPGEAVVIGAHIDTLSDDKPGADDDASGIAVALEVARVLLASDVKLDYPVYIIAYAAEERGLVGSGFVVKSFLNNKIPVKAVMQLDQAGYRANPTSQTIWLMEDYVDKKLTQLLADLLTQYVKIPVAYSQCGYACSDHANWSQEGFHACYPSATAIDDDNPYIHSSQDRLEVVNLDHMVNFTKLGLAFVAELAIK